MFNHNFIFNEKALFVTATSNHQPNGKEVEFIRQVAKTTKTTVWIPVWQHREPRFFVLVVTQYIFVHSAWFIDIFDSMFSLERSVILLVFCYEWNESRSEKRMKKENQAMKWKEMKRFVFQSWVSFDFMKLKFISIAFPVLKMIQKYEFDLVGSGKFHYHSAEPSEERK